MSFEFYQHRNLSGLHAPFSPSQSSWLRYDDEKATSVYLKKQAAKRGTRLHAWAKETIDLGIKQAKSKKTLCAYVNDAIGFKMSTEVVLFYSEYFFGTADAICFKDNYLRIHDLKTGESQVDMEQLFIYVALFCLEYRLKPSELAGIECRIYQSDDIWVENPTPEDIDPIIDQIVHLNKLLTKIDHEEA